MQTNNQSISTQVDELAAEANRTCGLIYEVFQSRFNISLNTFVDTLPTELKSVALDAALKHGYDPSEPTQEQLAYIQELEKRCAENGIVHCSHDLDPNCCPFGCGDFM